MSIPDDRTIRGRARTIGWTGPLASSFLLCWLASHRDRLHTFVLGGKRLSLLLIWDSGGDRLVQRSDGDVNAIHQIVYGYPAVGSASPEERESA